MLYCDQKKCKISKISLEALGEKSVQGACEGVTRFFPLSSSSYVQTVWERALQILFMSLYQCCLSSSTRDVRVMTA